MEATGHLAGMNGDVVEEAIAILETDGGALSSGERVVLMVAWAFWNSAQQATLADIVYLLDPGNLRAVATLMLALARGGPAIDQWIAAMDDAWLNPR